MAAAKISEAEALERLTSTASGPSQAVPGSRSASTDTRPLASRTWTIGPVSMNSPVIVVASTSAPPPLPRRSMTSPSTPSLRSSLISLRTSRVLER